MPIFNRLKWLHAVMAGAVILLLPSLAWAGAAPPGSITFSPDAESIPALGGTMLVLLSLLLAFIAFLSLRRKRAGGGTASLLVVALVAGSLVSAVGGITLVRESHADIPATPIVDPNGETLPIQPDTSNPFVNNSGVPMNVTRISLPSSGCPAETATGFPGACALGATLAPGETCEVDCALAASDRRLKTDIEPMGVAANGLPLYNFRYVGGQTVFRGVMAQDVLEHTPSAVVRLSNGYLAVNYRMLDLRMITVQ